MWRRNKPAYSAHAWRQWGYDHPELAAMVARITLVLGELERAARSGTPRRNSPEGVALVEELMQLGTAVTQWTRQFAGDEAQAWQEQLVREVDARLERVEVVEAEHKRVMQEAVERERDRKLRETQAPADQVDDSAPAPVTDEPGEAGSHAYGDYKKQLAEVISERRAELSAMASTTKRAEFLAKEVGCSPSTARDALRLHKL